jgi:hypothetical protein
MGKTLSDQICCPKFIPEPWEDKIIKWDKKRFIKDKVFTLFFIPINYGSAMTRLTKRAEDSGLKSKSFLCLSEHTSLWNMNLYLEVDKEVAGTENITLSGEYYCRVYEGDFSRTGEWSKDFDTTTKAKGYNIKKLYMWYTTCPECAKKYGKNYTVFIGQL